MWRRLSVRVAWFLLFCACGFAEEVTQWRYYPAEEDLPAAFALLLSSEDEKKLPEPAPHKKVLTVGLQNQEVDTHITDFTWPEYLPTMSAYSITLDNLTGKPRVSLFRDRGKRTELWFWLWSDESDTYTGTDQIQELNRDEKGLVSLRYFLKDGIGAEALWHLLGYESFEKIYPNIDGKYEPLPEDQTHPAAIFRDTLTFKDTPRVELKLHMRSADLAYGWFDFTVRGAQLNDRSKPGYQLRADRLKLAYEHLYYRLQISKSATYREYKDEIADSDDITPALTEKLAKWHYQRTTAWKYSMGEIELHVSEAYRQNAFELPRPAAGEAPK